MMNKRMFVFLVLVLSLVFVQVGSATVSYSSFNRLITVTDESSISLSEISSTLSDSDAIWNDGTIWYINGSMKAVNSSIYINSSDGSELRMLGDRLSIWNLYSDDADGEYYIQDFTVSSWDNSTQQYATGKGDNVFHAVYLNNVTFRYANTVINGAIGTITDIKGYNCKQIKIDADDTTVDTVYMQDSTPSGAGYAFLIDQSDNVTYRNININTTTTVSSLVGVVDSTNTHGYNIQGRNAGDYLNNWVAATGSYGFVVDGGSNAYAENITLNGSKWSTFGPTGQLSGGNFKNITIRNSGHNGLDIHPASNIYIEDLWIYDSLSNNVIITAGTHSSPAASNITIENMHLVNGGMQFSDNVSDITVVDSTVHNGSYKVFDCTGDIGTRLFNVTFTHDGAFPDDDEFVLNTEISTYNVGNGTMADVYAYRIGRFLSIPSLPTPNQNFINVNSTGYTPLQYKNNITMWYYPNISVVDANDNPLENVVITSNIPVLNGWGEPQSTFYTDSNGKLYDSGNRSNWMAIPDEYYNVAGSLTTSYTVNLTAVKSGETNTSVNVNPDSSWYSPDPSDLQGPLQTFVLSAETPVTPTDDWYTNSKTSMIDDIDSSLQLAGVILIVLGGVAILGILAAVMKYELDTTVAIGAIVLIIISGAVLIIGLMMISGMVDAMP